jgi:hypothetical protein
MILLRATRILCSSVSKREMLRSLTSVRSIYLSTYQNLLVDTRCKVQVLFLLSINRSSESELSLQEKGRRKNWTMHLDSDLTWAHVVLTGNRDISTSFFVGALYMQAARVAVSKRPLKWMIAWIQNFHKNLIVFACEYEYGTQCGIFLNLFICLVLDF